MESVGCLMCMLAEPNPLTNGNHPFQSLFDQPPPSPLLRVSVIVPVRNEAEGIAQTLDALRHQRTHAGATLDPDCYEVLVLTNNCTDDSYRRVRTYQHQHPTFRLHVADIQLLPEHAHIGTVRRLLMDAACRRLVQAGHPRGIIASTDGDTQVDPQWLAQTITEIDAGNDAVAGRILTRRDPCHCGTTRLPHLRDATYRSLLARAEATLDPHQHDPWPRHFQHFGASLAVTYAAYSRAGRLPVVRYLEDEAFYRALQRIDARVRRSPQVRVYTSARHTGRVEVGLSWQLQQWANQQQAGCCQMVEHPSVSLARFRLRHDLRRAWQCRYSPNMLVQVRPIAQVLGVSTGWVMAHIATNTYFGQCWEPVETRFNAHVQHNPIPITEAIRVLRT
jgi:hypothetical protein